MQVDASVVAESEKLQHSLASSSMSRRPGQLIVIAAIASSDAGWPARSPVSPASQELLIKSVHDGCRLDGGIEAGELRKVGISYDVEASSRCSSCCIHVGIMCLACPLKSDHK